MTDSGLNRAEKNQEHTKKLIPGSSASMLGGEGEMSSSMR